MTINTIITILVIIATLVGLGITAYLYFKEKTLNSMTITYSFKENRNRKYFIVILNPLEEFEIPDITKEDAIDFLDYFIEDEKN